MCVPLNNNKSIAFAYANGLFEDSNGKSKLILNSYGKVYGAENYHTYLKVGNLLASPGQCLIRKSAIPSDTYSVLVKDKNIYGSKILPLPSPTFVVFYNGKQKMDEEGELRLSDAFVKKQEIPNLEVIVKMKNINMGNSRELFEKCRPMRDYMIFVDKVRRYSQEQPLEDAVERTIRECMEEDVMADFLKRNRAEGINS